MKKKLAIIGASYLQLPLVRKAREMGVSTLCFAWEDGAVCKDEADEFIPVSITEKERIAEICREKGVDGVTSIASDVAVPTMCHVAAKLALVGNSEKSAQLSTNKFLMRKALAEAGVRCPPFSLVRSVADARSAVGSIPYPVIVKPCDRSGSMGVTRVEASSELDAAVEMALACSFCHQAVLEAFIEDAREVSVEGISWAGEHFVLAVTDKVTTGAPHYVELGHHQPSDLPESIVAEAIAQVKRGIRALGIEYGASHPELMVTQDGDVYVTEIGARMGGDFIGSDLVQLSTGYDFLRGVVEVALGRFTPPAVSTEKCSGVWFYSPQTPEVKDLILNRHPAIMHSELHPEALKELTRSADRAGYFVYQACERLGLRSDSEPRSTFPFFRERR